MSGETGSGGEGFVNRGGDRDWYWETFFGENLCSLTEVGTGGSDEAKGLG